MNNCIFCSIIKENKPHHEIWWSDDAHIAFLDAQPTQHGHTLVIPKIHSENILDLTETEYAKLMLAAKKVAERMKVYFEIDRVALFVEGLSVPHTHVHLVPIREKGDLGPFTKYQMKEGEFELLGRDLGEI